MLGIDAAWTLTQPSGVALVVEEEGGWRVPRVSSSYASFIAPEERGTVGRFNSGTLLATSAALCGGDVSLVAVDMPWRTPGQRQTRC